MGRAVRDYVDLNAWQVGKIEAGLQAADAGAFAADEDVLRVRGKFVRPG